MSDGPGANLRSGGALTSYVKTMAACVVLVPVALLFSVIGPGLLPAVLGPVVAVVAVLAALGAAVLACAGAIVVIRFKRNARGDMDLFLGLNRSREPAALEKTAAARKTRLRRWIARRLLGHDLVAGDLVEIRTWTEIRATLDERGCLGQLPFMPEMLAKCGQRAHVFRCMHRLFDYRKTRRMRHMDGAVLLVGAVCDGSGHGGCEAACHTLWKSAWLRRVEPGEAAADSSASDRPVPQTDVAVLQFGTRAPRYTCQLTQLHAASKPIRSEGIAHFLRPLVSGNVAPAAFIVGWLTHLFNEVQHLRQGVSFPAFEAVQEGSGSEMTRLEPGDQVVVRPPAEIRATLNDQSLNRGLYFEPDMLKHCGHRYCVQSEVAKLIDIVSGEMLTMKTPAYILRDIRFSGERQLFNAQHEPLFWRSAWLKRDGG
ncbi:MAG: hypothetical protein ABI831_00780 [Betaproteobacteria bacterium]